MAWFCVKPCPPKPKCGYETMRKVEVKECAPKHCAPKYCAPKLFCLKSYDCAPKTDYCSPVKISCHPTYGDNVA